MRDDSTPARFRGLPRTTVLGRAVPLAASGRARLLGLALLPPHRAGPGLLIPRCASVHTFGMRFPIDIWFLDRAGEPLSMRRAVPPRRLVWERGAAAVLEIPAEDAPRGGNSPRQGGESGPRRP